MHRAYSWVVVVLIFCASVCHAGTAIKRYDVYFHKYSKAYFGYSIEKDWFKAQGIVESNLDCNAVSWAGASGIMQIMPRTWHELRTKLSFKVDALFDPEWNIAAGIYYDRYMYDNWKSERPFDDRISLVFASYNGGLGNVLKSQKQCVESNGDNCNLWEIIKEFAPFVKSWRFKESLDYVDRIFKIKKQLEK